MDLYILVFSIVLLSTGSSYALKCHKCAGNTGACTLTEMDCSSPRYLCGARKIVSYAGGSIITDIDTKGCFLPEECEGGSVNYGISRTVVSIKCCHTNLCNIEDVPEPRKSQPNGKKCYHCTGPTCTATLNCQGTEDHCISKTVTESGNVKTAKGCATEQICSKSVNLQLKTTIGGDITCCQGDYCNGAASISASLLLLGAPLIAFFLFS